jgi:hypothetical protein
MHTQSQPPDEERVSHLVPKQLQLSQLKQQLMQLQP